MSKPLKSQFGGAMQAAVEAVVEEGASAMSVADAGSKEAFLDAWRRALTAHARHLRSHEQALEAPVVLVHVSNSVQFASKLGWTRQPMLGTAPTDHLAGILAVGTADIGGCIHPTRFKDSAQFVSEIGAVGLGSALTIALMSNSMLVIWPHGIDGDQAPYQHELDDAPVILDLDAVARDLEQFYELVARQTTTWWSNANARITVENPEATVQNDLWIFLLGKYAAVAKVKRETNIGNGRSDLTVDPLSHSNRSAVLELKATRDVRTPKVKTAKPSSISLNQNIEWAKSGVQQTAAYRDHEGFDGAFLCVYDFCAGNLKEIDEAIQAAALQYNVIARRYWITATNKEHREERYPLEKKGR